MSKKPTVFMSYAKLDAPTAKRIHDELQAAGADLWLDVVRLLPGQHWEREIESAIGKCRYFLALLSKHSLDHIGFVQKELKIALAILDCFPTNKIFLIPVRLEVCVPSDTTLRALHWIDMFAPHKWADAMETIKLAIGLASTKPSAQGDKAVLLQILNAGLKPFSQPIRDAKSSAGRDNAIKKLRKHISCVTTTYQMPDIVFDVFVEACAQRCEYIDPDGWAIERLSRMNDLDQATQQAIFDYGLKRMLSMNGK